ncbi:hypothetical protein D046_3377B, partial [Vibrio parahaemolyticus V-223/04]
GLLNL